METIPVSTCIKIGNLRKPHGIRGDVLLTFKEEFEDSIAESSMILVEIEGLLVPFFIGEEGIRFRTATSAIISLEWIDTAKSARDLCGNDVYLKRDEIIHPNKDKVICSFTGYLVYDPILGEIGEVKEANDFAGNMVLTVNYNETDILIPFNKALVHKIDNKTKIIYLRIPDGLLGL